MITSELIQEVSKQAKLEYNIAKIVVDTFFDSMTDALVKGEGIEIRGFGSFQVREYKERKMTHPRFGHPITIKPLRRPHFKVGKELRERVNGNSKSQPVPEKEE